ncbi:hypothetical protein E3Q18_02892 [Wallemia mellicola]|uniref:Uncharacterized protein n=1 Tax=Wallemia mellicola TaxID=1708541 RepID=A0A4V6TQN2_9BASI|nr:hypothetical protein E3Q24_02639 [Wallemia mellicola]TIB83443.1 hypothetical protein E3Q21_02920 [Wallemia mellicola]TIB86309.1 hypothetical protein E3Q20_02912 [Wallemia mellicola]TIB96938.1 hypothetical protein E3Q18_02892 [Wallemia mellicola]TIC04113.1 hypothetical protein E3Q16_02818 [Wallemia mellicola]
MRYDLYFHFLPLFLIDSRLLEGKPPRSMSLKPAAPLSTKTNSSTNTKKENEMDISSPHELTAFVRYIGTKVEDVLNKLDTKFDVMSNTVLERMNEMSDRVDSLEASIQELVSSAGPMSPRIPSPRPVKSPSNE